MDVVILQAQPVTRDIKVSLCKKIKQLSHHFTQKNLDLVAGQLTIAMKKRMIYWICTLAVIFSLTIPTLVREGMFLDGITYAAVSKNMANGNGSFWSPHYTKTVYPDFHEQPSFVFIIQSYFFKIFGNKFYTERIYCLVILVLTLIGIAQCWRLLTDKTELKEYDWFPVLLWITIPLVCWSYNSNLLENTMGVFTIFAVFSILKSLLERKPVGLFVGSVLTILAFISKGFAGLFPLIVPVLYALVYKPHKTTMLYAAFLIVMTVSIAYIVSIFFPGLTDNFFLYMDQQLIPALTGKREFTTDNRFSILLKLFMQLAFPITLAIYVIVSHWRKKRQTTDVENKKILLLCLIAIAASLPLIISFKQRKFYLIPAIPFYVLSISLLVIPFLKFRLENLSNSALEWIKRISLATLSIGIMYSIIRFGDHRIDREDLMDVYTLSQAVPEGTILTTTEELAVDWVLVGYMTRIGYLSLDTKNEHDYYLLKNTSKIENVLLEEYEMIDLNLRKYVLLKKKHR